MSTTAKTQLQLVEVHGQKLTTTSLIIAELFGRKHGKVLERLQSLIDDGSITQPDFGLSEYSDASGKSNKLFVLTERGFLISMPFIGGSKSRQGQVKLVDEFLRIKKILSEPGRKAELAAKRHTGSEMTDMLRFVRETNGKETTNNHYRNEHRLCNRALTGKWEEINEVELDVYDLRLLAAIRKRNTLLITRHPKQAERKKLLEAFVADYRAKHPRLKLVGA
jgi:Rha family phage regulatory protein